MLGISNSIASGYARGNMTVPDLVRAVKTGNTEGISEGQLKSLKRSGVVECATCASRQYQDGSDENVSFKSASHVAPEASGAAVRAHEQEHVKNAYNKAAQGNGKVINASVSIKTAICPECGRSYTAGGLTTTAIKYNESNPYMKNKKSADSEAMKGSHFDARV